MQRNRLFLNTKIPVTYDVNCNRLDSPLYEPHKQSAEISRENKQLFCREFEIHFLNKDFKEIQKDKMAIKAIETWLLKEDQLELVQAYTDTPLKTIVSHGFSGYKQISMNSMQVQEASKTCNEVYTKLKHEFKYGPESSECRSSCVIL